MNFCPLKTSHLSPLLEFELLNRKWFESFIEPRPESFYCKAGVAEHIRQLTASMQDRLSFNGVLEREGKIVARANLKDIDGVKATVGYRVAKHCRSEGVATYCLAKLIDTARDMNLLKLDALVLENNPASKRVLEKQAFRKVDILENYAFLNGQYWDCNVYRLNLND